MIYRKIGEDLVSSIGLGTGFHDPKKEDYNALEKTVKSSVDAGINFIDTAPVYGDGLSELHLGKVIGSLKRDSIFLASKISPQDTTYNGVIRSVEQSLKRLNTEWVDLYQIHWSSAEVPIGETMLAMEKLVSDGKIRNIGVSNFSLTELVGAASSLKNNDMASVQSEYNFFERSVEDEILPFCKKNNMFLIAYSPLAQGRMVNGKKQLDFLNKLAYNYGCSAGQLVLRWLIEDPNVIAIPNTSKPHRAVENASAADVMISRDNIEKMSFELRTEVSLVDTGQIRVTEDYGRKVYQTLEEALQNNMNMSPSPLELSKQIKGGVFLKPIRLRKLTQKIGDKEYDLVEGRLRYWSWVIAHGWKKPVPSLVWENN